MVDRSYAISAFSACFGVCHSPVNFCTHSRSLLHVLMREYTGEKPLFLAPTLLPLFLLHSNSSVVPLTDFLYFWFQVVFCDGFVTLPLRVLLSWEVNRSLIYVQNRAKFWQSFNSRKTWPPWFWRLMAVLSLGGNLRFLSWEMEH